MYNVVELFSGIGSQAKALDNIGMKIDKFYTCEWDYHAFAAYTAIHQGAELTLDTKRKPIEEIVKELSSYNLSADGKEKMNPKSLLRYPDEVLRRIYDSINKSNNFIDVSKLKGKDFPNDIDIMTYSFPCQDLSNVGAFHGYNKGIDIGSGSRSSLLWQVGRILREVKALNKKMPRFLLMENVPTLLSNRHISNFQKWISILDDLGYLSKYFPLNAKDFGIPQNRPRLLMISVYVGSNNKLRNSVKEYFDRLDSEDVVSEYKKSKYYKKYSIKNLLKNDYTKRKYFLEACECNPNDTVSRRVIWENNPQLVLKGNEINNDYEVIRTITTKQDRHPNSGNLYFDLGGKGKSKFRYLTPRECFLFMGFTEEDFESIIKNNPMTTKSNTLFPRDKLIRMAGNSIPVKLLEGVFYQIKKIDNKFF